MQTSRLREQLIQWTNKGKKNLSKHVLCRQHFNSSYITQATIATFYCTFSNTDFIQSTDVIISTIVWENLYSPPKPLWYGLFSQFPLTQPQEKLAIPDYCSALVWSWLCKVAKEKQKIFCAYEVLHTYMTNVGLYQSCYTREVSC